jgi:formylglycine-generating enzyme required for sulfatase activity
MFAVKFFLSCVICLSVCLSQPVSISGTVTEFAGGDGLAGAAVALANGGLETETNSNGGFVLTGEITSSKYGFSKKSPSDLRAGIKNSLLSFQIFNKEHVTIKMYSLKGREIFKTSGEYETGRNMVALPCPASGFYIINIDVSGNSHIMKTAMSVGTETSSINTPAITNITALKEADDFTDTLIITSEGYGKVKVILFETEKTDLDIKMVKDDVTPWVPSGAMEREGSMVKIKAAGYGFMMGQTLYNAPVHHVSFTRDFWMDTIETKQKNFIAITGKSSSTFNDDPEKPVDAVTWYDAVRYCNALSAEDGYDLVYDTIAWRPDYTKNGYRLPSEAEWEYACRAGTVTDFWWGKNIDGYPKTLADSIEIDSHAVWKRNSEDMFGINDDAYGPHIGGSTIPNSYGLYDMIGNVNEFSNDWLAEYSAEAITDAYGASSGVSKAIRGGAYIDKTIALRSAYRSGNIPNEPHYSGIRLVRTCEE